MVNRQGVNAAVMEVAGSNTVWPSGSGNLSTEAKKAGFVTKVCQDVSEEEEDPKLD